MKEFTEKPICDKCGATDIHWNCHASGQPCPWGCPLYGRMTPPEHIALTCTRCHYQWAMKCKDLEESHESKGPQEGHQG